jgi:thymidine kinase
MAKLYFYYSAMNAGKSTVLLQSSYNYQERGMSTLLYAPSFDDRFGKAKIASRIGLEAKAHTFDASFDFLDHIKTQLNQKNHSIKCILVDEAQFLSATQVDQLSDVVDFYDVPVLAYGLRTDFQGQLFPGSERLLAIADNLQEIKTICHCGGKANMVLRLDEHNQPIKAGLQIQIGGNDRYVSVCRKHFKLAIAHGQVQATD